MELATTLLLRTMAVYSLLPRRSLELHSTRFRVTSCAELRLLSLCSEPKLATLMRRALCPFPLNDLRSIGRVDEFSLSSGNVGVNGGEEGSCRPTFRLVER